AGVERHHDDAVGEEDRLLDRVGDEEDGEAGALPQAQELALQSLVRRPRRLGRRLASARASGRARRFAPLARAKRVGIPANWVLISRQEGPRVETNTHVGFAKN